MKIKLYINMCDGWIGYFWDDKRRILYWQPIIPYVGVKFEFN